MSLVVSGRSCKLCTGGTTFTSIPDDWASWLMLVISAESAEGIAMSSVVAPVFLRASAMLSRPPKTGTPEIESLCVSGLSSIKPTGKYCDEGFRIMVLTI